MKKTFRFPIGILSTTDRQLALNEVKERYDDATSDFTSPFKITATVEDMNEDNDADYYFGLAVGRAIAKFENND